MHASVLRTRSRTWAMKLASAERPKGSTGRRRWCGRRRWPGQPPACDLETRDTCGEPQQPCGVATHHVAEVVHPKVEPADPDGHDQQGGTQQHGYLGAPAMEPENHEHVGE